MTHLVSTDVKIREREMTEEWLVGEGEWGVFWWCQQWGGDGKDGSLIIKVLQAALSIKNWGWETLPLGFCSVFWSAGLSPLIMGLQTISFLFNFPNTFLVLFRSFSLLFFLLQSPQARDPVLISLSILNMEHRKPWSHYQSSVRATTDDSEWNCDRADCSKKSRGCETSCDSHSTVL